MALKLLSSCLLCLLLTGTARSQDSVKQKPLIYATVGAHIGSLYGPRVGVAAIFGKKHEIGIGWQGYLRESDRFPADYDCQSCKHGLPKDWIAGGAITYGYVLHPHFMPGLLRFVLRGGVLLGKQCQPADFRPVFSPGIRRDNYTFSYDPRFGAALLLNPTADFVPFRMPGFSVGPFAMISRDLSSAGLSVSFMLGRVGTRDIVIERRARQKAATPPAASDKPPY